MMQIKRVKKLTSCSHLNLYSIQYRDRVKKSKEWIFASRSTVLNPLKQETGRPDAVVVVPFHTPSEKLVIIREFRVVLGGDQYGFPAGLVDGDEGVAQAGERELFEETGLCVTRVLSESPALFSSSGLTDESVSLLSVECTGTPSSDHTEDSEDIQVVMVSREEAALLLSEPGLKFDVKTWIVLERFASHGII